VTAEALVVAVVGRLFLTSRRSASTPTAAKTTVQPRRRLRILTENYQQGLAIEMPLPLVPSRQLEKFRIQQSLLQFLRML
jgi:hypothetical protein